ncbi:MULTISPECIES: arylesterase [Methylomonas]|uniref:Arylesterase n=1 Tax=Methylomonas koyamae TaxID=702114 RepID=A0A177MVN3_9GAMM|nr:MULTISPECIES: arylesterase [Methylomonas]ANE57097.1 arylesterase [Methylomonas sp. DH-1]OAI09778.1 arylesterase [Methylomonas koyamae]OAI28283.1 arylesterase [Methylomonas koyamae]BBL60305.1 arylesterase [Methylomonas koyamae]
MYSVVLALVLSVLPICASAKSIVVLGDSISAGYGIEVQQGWVALLQKKIAARGFDYTIYNESISGDTTAGGLARLPPILVNHKPDILLLELGANDGLRGLSPEEMEANLAAIIGKSLQAGAKVILLAMKIPPNYGKRYVEMFYDIYPELAQEFKISYVPFLLEDIVLRPELMQQDGIHPNALAQPILADKMWKHLQFQLK